jgi:hypothetical protein
MDNLGDKEEATRGKLGLLHEKLAGEKDRRLWGGVTVALDEEELIDKFDNVFGVNDW